MVRTRVNRRRFRRRFPVRRTGRFGGKYTRMLKSNVFKTTRSLVSTNSLVVGNNYFALYYVLSGLPNYTEYTSLFDKYKIVGVQLTIIPYANSAEIGSNAVPILYYVPDSTDAALPTSVNQLLEYPRCKTIMLDKPCKFFIRPKVADALYQGAFTGYGVGSQFVSTSSPDVQHYGQKMVIVSPTATSSVTMVAKYYLQFRNPK